LVTYLLNNGDFMKKNEKDDNKFTYNDLIIIKAEAPKIYFPEKLGVICGFTKIKTQKLVDKYKSEIGNWIYIVEFENGSSIEIPERYLEKYEE